jgi:glycosyltransferase involved in cell wall biosynthesis
MNTAAPGEPVISIIVAVRNGALSLHRCLDSVLRQTWARRELIVIDGASSDGTVDIIESYSRNLTHWESGPDTGIYQAWNKALDHASGDWVLFLGCDDYLFSPQTLEQCAVRLRQAYPPYRVAYGRVAVVDETGGVLLVEGDRWEVARRRLWSEMTIPHQGVFHHNSLFQVRGRFDESFRIAGDYELLLRELKGGEALFLGDTILSCMQVGGYSTTPSMSTRTLREFRRGQGKNGLLLPRIGWLWSYTKAWVRHGLYGLLGPRGAGSIVNAYRSITGRLPRKRIER